MPSGKAPDGETLAKQTLPERIGAVDRHEEEVRPRRQRLEPERAEPFVHSLALLDLPADVGRRPQRGERERGGERRDGGGSLPRVQLGCGVSESAIA